MTYVRTDHPCPKCKRAVILLRPETEPLPERVRCQCGEMVETK